MAVFQETILVTMTQKCFSSFLKQTVFCGVFIYGTIILKGRLQSGSGMLWQPMRAWEFWILAGIIYDWWGQSGSVRESRYGINVWRTVKDMRHKGHKVPVVITHLLPKNTKETHVMSIICCLSGRDNGGHPCFTAQDNWWSHKAIIYLLHHVHIGSVAVTHR